MPGAIFLMLGSGAKHRVTKHALHSGGEGRP